MCEAIARAGRGLVDANLGGGLVKQRVPRQGEGRSGGFRTIIAFRRGAHSFFMYGFAKSERDNVDHHDLARFRIVAKALLNFNSAELTTALAQGNLTEVMCNA